MDYHDLLSDAPGGATEDIAEFLKNELPYFWLDGYQEDTVHPTNILKVEVGTFVYLYDFYSELGDSWTAPKGVLIEDRLLGAFGTSCAPVETRDKSRMRRWVGPTERHFGDDRDKGHVFGRSLGGGGDGPGINIWIQLRSLNQGQSVQGKSFRSMERYCAAHPGTFCFTRPRYRDQTSQPAAIEFGILLPDNTLWIERFEN